MTRRSTGGAIVAPMFQGPLRPLPSNLPLSRLLARVRSGELLGAWVAQPQYRRLCAQGSRGARGPLLLCHDLGFLLTRCGRVVLRVGEEPSVLGTDTIISWRALQIATATPYLPGVARLQGLFPGLRLTAGGFVVPVPRESPEEILALCIEEGVRITGTRIVYQPGTAALRELK